MNVPNLPISIWECRAEQPPLRKLVLDSYVTNRTEFDICILDAWVEVIALNGLKIAEGNLFESMHARVNPAIIPRGENGNGAFHIELPPHVLRDIEERRADSDLELKFDSRVLVAKVTVIDDIQILAVPFETAFGDLDGRFEYLIPQSEWIKLLKILGWSELELLELPTSRLRAIPPLTRALSRFEDAQGCYRRGEWEETMLNCRMAFEAIVKDATGNDKMDKASEVYAGLIREPKKADSINKLILELKKFLDLGRHEQLPATSIKRVDSQLALLLTGALLVYLGNQ